MNGHDVSSDVAYQRSSSKLRRQQVNLSVH